MNKSIFGILCVVFLLAVSCTGTSVKKDVPVRRHFESVIIRDENSKTPFVAKEYLSLTHAKIADLPKDAMTSRYFELEKIMDYLLLTVEGDSEPVSPMIFVKGNFDFSFPLTAPVPFMHSLTPLPPFLPSGFLPLSIAALYIPSCSLISNT